MNCAISGALTAQIEQHIKELAGRKFTVWGSDGSSRPGVLAVIRDDGTWVLVKPESVCGS